MKLLKALLFDLEGTLVESAYQQSPDLVEQLHQSTRKELLKLGVPEDALSGLARSALLRNKAYQWADYNLSKEKSSQLRANFDTFMCSFDMNSAYHSVLYSNTISTLEQLSGAHIPMGIVTNTSAQAAHYILTKFQLGKFFEIIVTSNDVSRLKPSPEMIYVAASKLSTRIGWLVGDSVIDWEAANNAGIKAIIVKRDGSNPNYKYDFLLTSLEELLPIILRSKD